MYLLNRYFAQVGDIIEQNGGFIDKLIGDGPWQYSASTTSLMPRCAP